MVPGKWQILSVCLAHCVQLFATWTVSRPGSSVHGIFQARILEWVVIFLLQGIKEPILIHIFDGMCYRHLKGKIISDYLLTSLSPREEVLPGTLLSQGKWTVRQPSEME